MTGTSPGTPGIPGSPGHAPGIPRDAPETPQGRTWDPWNLQGPLMAQGNRNISTKKQRQKRSIAVFELACCDPSREGLDRII